MIRTTLIRILLLPAFCAMSLVGCDCGTEPKEPLIRTPKPGSSFIYTYYSKDSSGQPIEPTRRTVSRTVLANGVTLMGKSNVVQYLEAGDTLSVHYEEDGDASFLQAATIFPNEDFPNLTTLPLPSFTVPARWVTFAYGSKGSVTIPSFDTLLTVPFNGFPVPVNIRATGTTSYIGEENLSIAGETIAASKGLLNVNISIVAALLSGSFNSVDTIWFAPKLGMFVRQDGITRATLPPQFGGNRSFGGAFNALVSYTMK